MTRLIFVVGVALAGMSFNLESAKAYTAPWCAVITIGEDSVIWDCRYRSVEECRPNVLAGNRGFCNPNPYFAAAREPVERRHQRKH